MTAPESRPVFRTPLGSSADGRVNIAGVTIEPVGARTLVNLRGRIEDPGFLSAMSEAIGVELPATPNCRNGADGRTAMWLGPDEWLIVAPYGEATPLENAIRAARPGDPWLSVVDLSHSYTTFVLSGPRMRELLAKGCPLDLHPRVFGAGHCAQSTLAKVRVLLCAVDEGAAIEAWFRNSYTDYAVRWLLDAAAEFCQPESHNSSPGAAATTNPG